MDAERSEPFESIDALMLLLKQEDPPPPQILPGNVEFEWLHKADGRNIIQSAADGMRFLYRGQNRRWRPCVASIWRNCQPTNDRKLNWMLSRARIAEFEHLLKQHPAMEIAVQNNLTLNYDSLAQHYGIPTFWLDVTSSQDVAAFFAVAEFHDDGRITPSSESTGVVYRVHWRRFDDPFRYFASISHSPASRPGRQHGWSLGLHDEVDFDAADFVEAFEFCHSKQISERIIGAFKRRLFPDESIPQIVKTLIECPAVTMSGIRAALARDGCPADQVERTSMIWGERLCNGLDLDVHFDEEFALTEEQILAGEADAALARESFLSQIGFRLVRFRKENE